MEKFWMLMAVGCSLFAAFAAFTSLSAWAEGYAAGRRRAIKDGAGIDTKKFAESLATIMDVQADGGDSPAAYVHWAIKEAKKAAAQEQPNDRG